MDWKTFSFMAAVSIAGTLTLAACIPEEVHERNQRAVDFAERIEVVRVCAGAVTLWRDPQDGRLYVKQPEGRLNRVAEGTMPEQVCPGAESEPVPAGMAF